MIYLDHNATTPLDPAVLAVVQRTLQADFGNPSSVHGLGQRARKLVDTARAQVAAYLGVHPSEIIFTSGATEANNLAWHGVIHGAGQPLSAVTSTVEHPSILGTAARLAAQGHQIERIGVDDRGHIDLDQLGEVLRERSHTFASFQSVNNELGTIQPIQQIGDSCRPRHVLLHCDATQAMGKIDVKPSDWSLDLLSFSGHKIGSLAGTGVLWVRRGVALQAQQPGHQEGGARAGTENILGIVALGHACTLLPQRLASVQRIRSLRDLLWQRLKLIEEVYRNGDDLPSKEVGNTLNIGFGDVDAATLLMALDLEGVAVSAGSACSSGSLEPSHVITALGQSRDRARQAVRFSLGPENSAAEIERVALLVPEIVARIRAARQFGTVIRSSMAE